MSRRSSEPVATTGPSRATGVVLQAATNDDWAQIWCFLEPVLRAGATLALPVEWGADEARAFWFSPAHSVRVAKLDNQVVGSYYLKANQLGHGAHLANCGYVTDRVYAGRGVATAMCLDSLDRAREAGFEAMLFNLVVETNERAIRLWSNLGFAVVGRIPEAFRHPSAGMVAALVMWRTLAID